MIVYTFGFDDKTRFRFEVDEEGDSSVEFTDQPVAEPDSVRRSEEVPDMDPLIGLRCLLV